ncbi:MAG: hypothetical protein ABSG15_03680 [FCB group bacterium]|jgi:hypothetical protein
MTNSVKNLINTFDTLPSEAKQEAVYQILRRVPYIEMDSLSDEALVAVAEEIFLELDYKEAMNAKTG